MAYDPVYAHEYYMLHRKLKGRKRSTSTETKKSNITQRVSSKGLSKEARSKLKDYYQQLKDKLADDKANITEAKKLAIEHMNKQMQNKIDFVKALIKRSTSDKEKQRLRNAVKELRQTKKDTRSKIVQSARDMYTNARNETNKAYNSMVERLKKSK